MNKCMYHSSNMYLNNMVVDPNLILFDLIDNQLIVDKDNTNTIFENDTFCISDVSIPDTAMLEKKLKEYNIRKIIIDYSDIITNILDLSSYDKVTANNCSFNKIIVSSPMDISISDLDVTELKIELNSETYMSIQNCLYLQTLYIDNSNHLINLDISHSSVSKIVLQNIDNLNLTTTDCANLNGEFFDYIQIDNMHEIVLD